ncbi:hypothetical protein ES707_20961 [subsurface metagenome]
MRNVMRELPPPKEIKGRDDRGHVLFNVSYLLLPALTDYKGRNVTTLV